MGKEKIFKIMSQIKEEIETQMPFDPYRTRISLYKNRKINEQSESLKLYKEIEEARVVFEIHQYFNKLFSVYLIQNHLHSPQELTEVQKRAFKSEALTQSDKISEIFQQRKRILQIENSSNSDHIRAYLFNNIDALTATLFNTGNLIFEDRELQNQFNLDYELSEFRKIITEQCFDESIMKLPKGESESITECQKIA
ncbi:MAG TPA: hypothetical protein PK657_05435 [Legionella sp.]|nr:hypothetical protein [Legionella sp.]